MIKAVLFDLDGTLYDRDALVAALIAEQFRVFERDLAGISRERFVRDVLEMDDHGYGEKAAGYRRVVRAWNADPALVAPLVEYFWAHYDRHCRLSEDTQTTLQMLRSQGAKLGVITNGQGTRQRCKLAALGLLESFDAVLISEEEGVRKPDAEIFRRALERCGVAAHEAVFVGDHPQADIEGARNAGLVPIWKSVPYWQLATPGTRTVQRLSEILPFCSNPAEDELPRTGAVQ
jgi:putative hydrolase of the HAD superfamily